MERIDLSGNEIKFINKNALQGLNKLTMPDLRYNQLTTLEEGLFDPLNKNIKIFLEG